MIRRPPPSPLCPYTTLFRSSSAASPSDATGKHSINYFEFREVSKAFDDRPVLNQVSFAVKRGETHLIQHRPIIKGDRKSTRLNSSHRCISYAVLCLKKKKKIYGRDRTRVGGERIRSGVRSGDVNLWRW